MANEVKSVVPLTLAFLIDTLATGDGKDVLTIPINGRIHRVHIHLGTVGASSGTTDISVYFTIPSGGAFTSGDLWTVASGVGRIAESGTQYLDMTASQLAITQIEKGGTLSLNIDAVCGTPAKNLLVTLYVYPDDD